jgi:hypothetical protein
MCALIWLRDTVEEWRAGIHSPNPQGKTSPGISPHPIGQVIVENVGIKKITPPAPKNWWSAIRGCNEQAI